MKNVFIVLKKKSKNPKIRYHDKHNAKNGTEKRVMYRLYPSAELSLCLLSA